MEYIVYSVRLRANNSGNVENFDLSPLVAAFIRKTFDGSKLTTFSAMYQYSAPNQYSFRFSIDGVTQEAGNLLFGAGNVPTAEIAPNSPYFLRRNTATIHYYQGLPGTLTKLRPQKINSEVYILDREFKPVRTVLCKVAGDYFATVISLQHLGIPTGDYWLSSSKDLFRPLWNDADIWNDDSIWYEYMVEDAVLYPLRVYPSPADCIRAGAQLYVRYWNSRGAWSYALLTVLRNDLKAKTEYADSWRLDAQPVDGRIFGDRVQTSKEMTYSIVAGRDGLDRLEVDELRDLQRSWCVQVWDIDQDAWRDCYVDDITTQNNGGRSQEMTFTIEMPHEYTFTR